MPHGKKPEDTPTKIQVLGNAILPSHTEIQLTFLDEAHRARRFSDYRRTAQEYLDLAEEAKADATETTTVLEHLLNDLHFSIAVLGTEDLVETSRPALSRALAMLASNVTRGGDGRAHYNEKTLAAAKLSAGFAFSDIEKVLAAFTRQEGSPDEAKMKLSPVTARQKRVAKDKTMPKGVKEREIPRLSDEIKRNLTEFASGNAIITSHDIQSLMSTLHTTQEFFRTELDACRALAKDVEDLRGENMSEEQIRAVLEKAGIRKRIRTFQEMVLELEVALRIASARMEFVNKKDTALLARHYDVATVRRLLQGVMDGSLTQKKKGNRVLSALKGLLPKSGKPARRERHPFEDTLGRALVRRQKAGK